MKTLVFITLALLVITPFTLEAKTVVRGGEAVSITDGQVIEHDFYAWGSRVSMSGEVLGDMHSLGGQVAINGNIRSDLGIIGGGAQVYGAVEDDVRIFAGESIIAGPVAGDVFVIGGTLTILSTAAVEGDVIFYGGELTVEGRVGGDVQGAMSQVRIDGEVGGVNVSTERLTLGDNATVKGDVQYKSSADAVRSPNATLEGAMVKNTPAMTGEEGSSFRVFLVAFVVLAASGLVTLLILRRPFRRILATPGDFRFDVLYGAATLLFLPLVAVFALSSVLLLPIGIVLLFSYFAGLAFTMIFMVILIGYAVLQKMGRPQAFNGIEVILGAFLLVMVAMIPVLGVIIVLFIFCATLGFLLRKAAVLLK